MRLTLVRVSRARRLPLGSMHGTAALLQERLGLRAPARAGRDFAAAEAHGRGPGSACERFVQWTPQSSATCVPASWTRGSTPQCYARYGSIQVLFASCLELLRCLRREAVADCPSACLSRCMAPCTYTRAEGVNRYIFVSLCALGGGQRDIRRCSLFHPNTPNNPFMCWCAFRMHRHMSSCNANSTVVIKTIDHRQRQWRSHVEDSPGPTA